MLQQPENTTSSTSRMTPIAVGGLAFVTAVVTGFGVVVIGNDLGPVLADASTERTTIWRPFLIFLCLPVAVIVAAAAVATVTGSRRPASAMASGAVVFGTLIGALTGRVVWRFIELQTYNQIRGLLDATAVLVFTGSVLAGGVAGALLGDRFGAHTQAKRISQWSNIVATALLTYPTMELIAGRKEIGSQQLWMLGFMLLALGLAPRIGLLMAEGDDVDLDLQRSEFRDLHAQRDSSASVRLVIGFAAGWMTSILVNMSTAPFDGQLVRYVIAWTLPALLAAPGVLAHLDRLGRGDHGSLEPAVIESFNR